MSEEEDTNSRSITGSTTNFPQDYDEYEQQQPSPWSQSPAPSPAIMDSEVNPFFQSPPDIDDEAFNPVSPEIYYDKTSVPFPPPISNVHSVVHIPLFRPSDIVQFQSSTFFSTKHHSHPAPIGILSFLAPIVPYPQVLIASISSLAPFIAASFTNAIQNFYIKKENHFYRRYSSNEINIQNESTNDQTRRSSLTSTTTTTPRDDYFDENYEGDEDEKSSIDLTSTTPTIGKRPDHLGSMSNFTRSSLETVTEQKMTPMSEVPLEIGGDDGADKKSLSPSSAAVIEGWEAVSPTTGLPISASIPPHAMCSNKHCIKHSSKSTKSSATAFCTDEQHIYKTKNTKRVALRQNRKSRKNSKYKRHKRQLSKLYEDDGFHYHSSRTAKETVDRLLVAPKSSLLRLIIDGIPIHVFTCSPTSGQITWVNNRMLQYTGGSLKDHLGPKWLSHMHPDDQPECRKAWEVAFEQGNGFSGEYRLRRFDDLYRCFLWRIVPLRDLKGKIIHWFGTCTDVHDQKVAKESNMRQLEIESNERKYRLLAEAIPQIVFTFSPSGGITYTNCKWSSYSGKSFDQTMGLGFMSCVHPEDRAKLQLPDLPTLQQNKAGISWQTEIRLLSYKDEYKWFLVKCVSVDELDTGDVRWFGTCTDINDHKLLEQKLKEAHDAAQRSTESKTRFLSNMSHEIRTPLIGITGMLNFLLDTELTAEQTDYVHTIQQSAESLLVVINDILDLSKVEAGMMKLEWEPFNLVTTIEDTNELMSTLAIQKNLELSFWIDNDIPNVIVGDRIRLRQVLLNLIGNAIKFTSVGEVFTKCTVQKLDTEESNLTLLFEVVDTGTGFDAEDESIMFKPFSQVDSSSTRKHGGSGLGLVISRQLIELHGGKMSCKSEKGKGSVFYFTVKFGIPVSSLTQPQPHTPKNELNHDPFFRTHGYGNTAMLNQQKEEKNSPVTFVNRKSPEEDIYRFEPSAMAHSMKHSQLDEKAAASSPAEILQDVLMSKAVSMQLKPPPVRNPVAAASKSNVEAAVKSAPPKPLGTFGIDAREVSTQLHLSNIGSNPGSLNSPSHPIISPPRASTYATPLRVLIVSQWEMSRESTVKHVDSILSNIITKNNGEQQILLLTKSICSSLQQQQANVLVITTPMQRSAITESAKNKEDEVIPKNCGFVFKPLKQTKLQWYFGTRKQQELKQSNSNTTRLTTVTSNLSTPDTPYKRAATQKEVFERMEADII
ncbi:hypothetical protein RO3G_06799 [Rhizopus delemar RA 99-880]|uniref:histidine kinase n=1 Tax=Rhizopus delemar (strain RA 99-880 / ATCC MYA-4621 / FGSC 9543 / NRRL 43880) TaxID=246409 RepID=I1C0W4_RHIO9|nr:hypothetical protein RO3G_06799 [Rhizopus delemar RA 99-880]|eukprot:EIE82094.1 hypothetical protein RO3G_06799 [Rhizopus delemar RA 99-880]